MRKSLRPELIVVDTNYVGLLAVFSSFF
jgi:hypothetical protein